MEEEEVQVKVQLEDEEIGEKYEGNKVRDKEREQTIKSHTWMTMRMRRSAPTHS